MKLPQLLSRKRLRAMTARRAIGAAEMDYEEMSEPNMKLSRALLIVLVLHVVAVAGIIAFNTIKTRQGPAPRISSESPNVKAVPSISPKTEPPSVVAAAATQTDEAKVPKASAKALVKDDRKSEPGKLVENTSGKSTGTKTYVVAKGDSPVSIARKFKIPYDDLMEANGIEDPHKLRIGQKLIIPKTNKSKKANQ